MKTFKLITATLLAACLGVTAAAQSIEDHLATQPDTFSRDQIIGRWKQVAHRTGDANFEVGDGSYIFFVAPADARSDEIELHTKARKWITDATRAPSGGRFSATFEYYPKANEISSAIPKEIHADLEGVLKWTAKLDVHHNNHSPALKLTFLPGEVRWEYDPDSGEVTSHEVVGEGEPRELIYALDPILGVGRAPTQRLEVVSFSGPEAKRREGESVTPQVLTTMPGQKMYPQAYLDETIAEDRGRRIELTITGDESGETASVMLESRGVVHEREMRYGIGLSRAAHPLGHPMTLAPNCGANDPYLYPPVLSWQWVNEYFATEELAATREKGSCVDFDGTSGETVTFSIGDDVVYRVQWYANFEDIMLAQYNTMSDRFEATIKNASGPNAGHALAMLGRFDELMLSDALTARQKIAVAAVYFAGPGAETFPTGLVRTSREQAAQNIQWRRENWSSASTNLAIYYGFSRTYRPSELADFGRSARDLVKTIFAGEDMDDPRVFWERMVLDEALMVASARQLEAVFDTFTRDGFRLMVNSFSAINLGGKVFSIFHGVDAFGNKMSDEAYWLNIVDVAAEFTMLGATVYEISAPLRFHTSGTNGKVARFTDGLGGSRGQSFKARMQGNRTANIRHYTARDPSGLSQVIDVFETISDSFPSSIRQAQRRQIVVNAEPPTRLLPLPESPNISVRVTPRSTPRRATKIAAPADPITAFGDTARVAYEAPPVFRAASPDAPDAVAGNFIVYRQTGRTITEAQGNAHLTMAIESLSEGQPSVSSGILSFGRTEPVPNAVFAHRMELQGIEVASFVPDNLNMVTTKAAVDGGWTVEVQLQSNGGTQRRVYVTNVEHDRWGIGADVDFFDPSRGQVVRMDVDEFADLVVVDTDNPVTTYRARDPSKDPRRRTPVEFETVEVAAPITPTDVSLPTSATPQANTYFRFQTDAGEQVIALGEKMGNGAINGVYRAVGRDGQVVRISLDKAGNVNQVLNDWWARSFLGDDAIDPDVIAPIHVHERRLIAEGLDQIQVLELVDEFSGTLADTLVKQQGGQMTEGQAAAYVAAARQINDKGGIWVDGHLNNFTFIQTGEDSWKVQIFDPGGVYPIKGETASARAVLARQIQTEAWSPDDIYQRRFQGQRVKIEKGFKADFINKYAEDIAAQEMNVPGAEFAEFDMTRELPANFFVPFQQERVRRLITATR
ncbi:hypothetical protein [Phaeobacter sp. C3_T13_0]|uniref:hypothetical protein n=1 Tax=Phaeobacter cretensis TaxID=3342641 RepID=UPI0039BC3ACF